MAASDLSALSSASDPIPSLPLTTAPESEPPVTEYLGLCTADNLELPTPAGGPMIPPAGTVFVDNTFSFWGSKAIPARAKLALADEVEAARLGLLVGSTKGTSFFTLRRSSASLRPWSDRDVSAHPSRLVLRLREERLLGGRLSRGAGAETDLSGARACPAGRDAAVEEVDERLGTSR